MSKTTKFQVAVVIVFLCKIGMTLRSHSKMSKGFARAIPMYVSSGIHTMENRFTFIRDANFEEFDEISGNGDLTSLTSSRAKFGKSLEDSPALVLNANFVPISYLPLSLWNWQDSLRAVLNRKAVALHYYDIAIRSVSLSIQIPSVIVMNKFQKTPESVPAMTRRNVYLRDDFRCQYCLESFHPSELSLDHVHPRSKGGKLTWTNTVCSCHVCNHKKGSHLPRELSRLGMRLRSLPHEPTHYELQHKAKSFRKSITHPSWDTYL